MNFAAWKHLKSFGKMALLIQCANQTDSHITGVYGLTGLARGWQAHASCKFNEHPGSREFELPAQSALRRLDTLTNCWDSDCSTLVTQTSRDQLGALILCAGSEVQDQIADSKE